MIHRITTDRMQQMLNHTGEYIYHKRVTRKACDTGDKNRPDAATVAPQR